MSSISVIALTGLSVYLVFLFIIGILSNRVQSSGLPDEHYIASGKLGLFTLFFTLFATIYSGNSLVGHPAEGYQRGLIWIMSIGFMIASVVMMHLVVPKLRILSSKHQFITPGDYLRVRFEGDHSLELLRILIALIMLFALSNFLFAQLKALGEMAELISGGLITYKMGMIGLSLVILWYESMGGMRAVAWTDTLQGILMLVGLTSLTIWVYHQVGGLDHLMHQLSSDYPDATTIPTSQTGLGWFSTMLYIGLASAVYPQALQRVFCAKSSKVLKCSLSMISLISCLTTSMIVFIGIGAITIIDANTITHQDQLLPALLIQYANAGVYQSFGAVLFLIACLAAIMSTADSVLLSFGSLFTRDLLGRTRRTKKETQLGKRIIIALTVVIACFASFRDITLWRLIELKLELLIQCFPAMVISLHVTRFNALEYSLGILIGLGVYFMFIALGVKSLFGINVCLFALMANLSTVILFAYLKTLRVNQRAHA